MISVAISVAFCLLSLIGYMLLRLACPATRILGALASPLLGLLLWVLLLDIALTTEVSRPFEAAAYLILIGGAASIAYSHRKKRFDGGDLIVAVPCAVVTLVFLLNTRGTNGGDSAYMIMMGVDIGRFQMFPADVKRELFYAYPLLLPLFQATIQRIAPDRFFNIAPALSILLMTFLAVLFRKLGYNWILSVIVVILLFSSPAMIIHTFYFNHHLICGFIILVFAYLVDKFEKNKEGNPIPVLLILLVSLPLVRLEGPFLAIILMAVFIRQNSFSMIQRIMLAFSSAMTVSIFYGYLLTFQPGTFNLIILSSTTVKLMILIGWLYVLYLLLLNVLPILSQLDQLGTRLVLNSVTIAVLLTCLLAPAKVAVSILAIFTNLFGFWGFWGFTWWPLVLGLIWRPESEEVGHRAVVEDPRFVTIVAMLGLMIVFLLLREANSVGFGDTFNRTMVHVLPIWAWLVMDRWRKTDTSETLNEETAHDYLRVRDGYGRDEGNLRSSATTHSDVRRLCWLSSTRMAPAA